MEFCHLNQWKKLDGRVGGIAIGKCCASMMERGREQANANGSGRMRKQQTATFTGFNLHLLLKLDQQKTIRTLDVHIHPFGNQKIVYLFH